MQRIHPSAVIDPGAKIASDVEIGPFSFIGPGVELGSGVVVASQVHISGRTRIGARSRIFPSAVLGAEPQVQGFSGPGGELVIGADNVIREFAAIHVGSEIGGEGTRIGDHNMIMNHVHLAHDCRIGSHCIVAGGCAIAGHVTIDDHAVLGGLSAVHQFARIGESAFLAAGSMLTKDAVPFSRVAGDRARFVGLNTIGLERRGFDRDTIAALRHAFHVIFQSKLRLDPALERVEEECGEVPEVARLLGFLKNSERGFTR
jgi:UDP-N-acetylglucosamine acyltransferase